MTANRHSRTRQRMSRGGSAYIYQDYKDNHVIWNGREGELKKFLDQPYGNLRHKLRNAYSSNSEDALTWSCFDTLRQVDVGSRARALGEIWELAFRGIPIPKGVKNGQIHIGKSYGDTERTEVDLSIEGPGALVFFEAKLYSPMSLAAPPSKPHNQIARKLRVGAREAKRGGLDFYFIVLDLAPLETLRSLQPRVALANVEKTKASGFGSKWLTSFWFARYKFGWRGSLAPLRQVLVDPPAVEGVSAQRMAQNMGWVTWADVFKAVLRAVVAHRLFPGQPIAPA